MPSGSKKRKAAKKKMESLAISSTIQQGNGRSESEIASPMSPDHGDRSDGKKEGGGVDGLNSEVESSQNGGGKSVEEHPIIPSKAEEVLSVPLVSESGTTLPVSGPKDLNIEPAEPKKDVVIDSSGVKATVTTEVGAKELLEASVPCVDVPGASTVLPVPIASEKEVDVRIVQVFDEKIEVSGSLEPTSLEKEGKVGNLGSLQPSPSEKREEMAQALDSGELPSQKIEQEQGSASLSDRTSTRKPAESGLHLQKADEDIGTEVNFPPQVARRTSLWNCCGLLDLFTRSSR